MSEFQGFPVHHLSSKYLEMDCLATAGPRIVRLSYKGSGNLLAEVPGAAAETPYGQFRYLGGHRLWHAPESLPRTYIPDGDGLSVKQTADGVLLEGALEEPTGIRKRIEVHLNPDQPKVTLVHSLQNEGLWDVELAPWAISMLRLGGTAILPIRLDDNPQGLLPNRRIALWPYTHLDDPRLKIEDEFIQLRGMPDLPPIKIGTFNPKGWTAYWLDGVLFRKSYAADGDHAHPDHDCNAEIYCGANFIELESLGPLSRLAVGASVVHTETWEFYESLEQPFLSEKMMQFMKSK